MKSETRVQSTSTTDIYTHMTLDEFIRAVQQHYFYRVYSLRIRTEASGTEPHTVIPYKVTVKTLGSDVFVMYGNEPYLDMKEFVHMFQGIPLITVSSDDFENDETTTQVETCASIIDINVCEFLFNPNRSYKVKASLMPYNDAMLSVIQKGNAMIPPYWIFRDEMNRRQ